MILELKSRGCTVFFSTHILTDAETLCDEIAVLRSGSVLAQGRLDRILDLNVSHLEVLVSGLPADALAGLPAAAVLTETLNERHSFTVPEAGLQELVGHATAAGGRILSVQPVRQSLEEFFFKELAQDRSPLPAGEAG
jgi:ABC-2 type transport system ATP-binding protein